MLYIAFMFYCFKFWEDNLLSTVTSKFPPMFINIPTRVFNLFFIIVTVIIDTT